MLNAMESYVVAGKNGIHVQKNQFVGRIPLHRPLSLVNGVKSSSVTIRPNAGLNNAIRPTKKVFLAIICDQK